MAKVLRIKPTQNQLDEMLRKHLSFEINRFKLGASMWNKPKYGTVADAMIRESCLIHMRLLFDFFHPRSTDPKKLRKYEDVFVTDYLPGFRKDLGSPDWLQQYRDKLDWQLAHLTMKRIEIEKKRWWQPEEPFKHLESLISEFLAALPVKTRALYDPQRGL
jgi:hypothetical protein